ncbi:hypothetical protein ACFC1T_09335 [Kitasatospora sp. NPDC056076]|uniref:hypothetical protein n=1 Tax=Kitasatospora sp. NPDC056076 TaxID=3345703 RepID=UPI0035E08EA3
MIVGTGTSGDDGQPLLRIGLLDSEVRAVLGGGHVWQWVPPIGRAPGFHLHLHGGATEADLVRAFAPTITADTEVVDYTASQSENQP